MLQRFNPLRKLVSSCCLLVRLTLTIPKAKITIPTLAFKLSWQHLLLPALHQLDEDRPCHDGRNRNTSRLLFRVPFRRIRCSGIWKPSNVQTPSPSSSRYRSVSFYITGQQCSLSSSWGSTAHSGAVKTLVTARHRVSQHQVTYLHRCQWFAGLPVVFAFLRLVVGGDIQ